MTLPKFCAKGNDIDIFFRFSTLWQEYLEIIEERNMTAEPAVANPDENTFTIEMSAKQGIQTFIMVAFGENLPVCFSKLERRAYRVISEGQTLNDVLKQSKPDTHECRIPRIGIHTAIVDVEAQFHARGRFGVVKASVPMYGEGCWHIADEVIPVTATHNGNQIQEFQIWCSMTSYDNFKIIAREPVNFPHRRWLVGCGFEDEVLLRGSFEEMPQWAKEVVERHSKKFL